MSEEMLTVKEAAARYGVDKSAIYRVMRQRQFSQGVRIGGSRRWVLSGLEAFEQGLRKAGR